MAIIMIACAEGLVIIWASWRDAAPPPDAKANLVRVLTKSGD